MKLLVLGATGSIGSQIVKQALEQGHQVTAFSRCASTLDSNPNLEIAEGDVLDYKSVEKAIPDHDAVFIALGAGSKGTVRSEGTRNIIQAMQKAGIRRLICLSTLGAGDSWDTLNFFWKYIMFGLFLHKAYADHQKQEQYIKNSDLDWTIVRPGAFTDGKLTGEYKHGSLGDNDSLTFKISRADVADFMLKQLQDDTYLRENTGRTTTDIITSRIEKEAKILLRQTEWTMSEIAFCLGFEEVAHFSNFFKKQADISPSGFRS